jgi:O-antigen/teichoic acid export membrane protein
MRQIPGSTGKALRAAKWDPRTWRGRGGAPHALVGSLLAGGASQAVLVVSGVLVARALGPADRGYMALVLLVPSVLALVGSLGLPLASTYFVARSPASVRSIARKLMVPAALQTAAGVVLTLLALLTVLSGEPARVISAGVVATALVPAILAQTYGLAILQGQRRFRAFNFLRVTPVSLYSMAVLIAFMAGFHSLVELTLVTVAANLLAAAMIVAVLLRGLAPQGDFSPAGVPSLSELIRFGLKGFFGSVSPVESFRLDQAAVALFLNPVSLGFYVVAQAFINLPRFLAQSVGMVAYPSVAAHADPREAQRSLWRHFALGSALTLAAVTVLEIAVPTLVPLFFGAEFSPAVPVARILLIGAFFAGARRLLADGVRGAGYPSLGSIAEAASWVLMLPAMIVLAPIFGSEGVALAATLAWAASLVVLLAATAVVLGGRGKRLESLLASLATRHAAGGLRWGQLLYSAHRIRRAGLVLPAFVTSLLAAAAAVFLDPYVSLGLAVLLGLLVLAGLVRGALSHRPPRPSPVVEGAAVTPDDGDGTQSRDGDDQFRLARYFYYAGFLVLGQLTLRPPAVGTISDAMFFASFASAASLLAIYKRRVAIPVPPLLLGGVLLFSLGAFASTFSSVAPNASIAVVLRLLTLIIVWFWLGTVVLRRREHVITATALWGASAALNGIGAIGQLTIDPYIIPSGYVHWGRATGFTSQPNDLGGIAAVALAPAVMFCMRALRNPVYVLAAYGGLLLTATGLILSGSVGALLAATVAVLIWVTAAPRFPARTVVFAGVALVGAVALLQFQQSNDAPTPGERLARVTAPPTDPNATLWSRVDTYEGAIDHILANPFTGVGLDSESARVGPEEKEPHNLVIGVWFRGGFFALAGVVLVLFAIASVARATLREAASVDEQMLALALLCAFVSFLVFAMGAPILYTRYGWAPAALLLALRATQTRRVAQPLAVRAPQYRLGPARVQPIGR